MTDPSRHLRRVLRATLGHLDAELAQAHRTSPEIRKAALRAEKSATARLDHLARRARLGDHEDAGMTDEALARGGERRAAHLVALHGRKDREE